MTPIDHALHLAANGLPCFPCATDKRPRTPSGFHDATTDPATITAWWSRWPDSLIGVPTGAVSGLYVLDIDVKDGKDGWSVLPAPLPPCRMHWTLTGGAHALFAHPGPGIRAKTDSDMLAPGLDRRGDGGYIIWWPAHGGLITDGPLAPPPAWMLAGASAPAPAPVSDVPPLGLSDDEIRAALQQWDGSTYSTWVEAGMAVHHETGGDERGLDMWDEASQVWPGYPSGGRDELAAKWGSFGRSGSAPVTMRSVLPIGWTRDPRTVGFGGGEVPLSIPGIDPDEEDPVSMPLIREVAGNTYMTLPDQVKHFSGCVYVRSLNRVMVPGGSLLDKERFDVVYGGFAFAMDRENAKVAKGAWDAFTKSQGIRAPHADGPCFRPELTPGSLVKDGGQVLVNTWAPVNTFSKRGDVSPFLELMGKLLPVERDRELLISWMAAAVQFPGDKFQWWPVLQGAEGNGKTFLLSALEYAIGRRYCHRPSASDLAGNGSKFNAWMAGKVLIGIEEIKVGHRTELIEILKDFVTNDRKEVQGKGADQVMMDNRANGVLFTNHKDGMPKRRNERRYAQFFTAQQSEEDMERDGMAGSYFPRLYAWARRGGLAYIAHYLKTYPLRAELSPALNNGGELHRAPVTSSSNEALALGMGPIEQEVLEAIGRCDPGFCGGWVSSTALATLVRNMGGRVHLTPHKQRELLAGLGYVPHPALSGGRVNNPIAEPGGVGKPRLYVKAGSIQSNETRPAEVARMYLAAQPGGFGADSSDRAVVNK